MMPVNAVNSTCANGEKMPRMTNVDTEVLGTALDQCHAEVEDVLGECEPCRDGRSVDEPVDGAVEVRPRERVDEQHAEALRDLLDERRLDHRLHGLVGRPARGDRHRELHAEIDDERDRDRHGGAPEEREPERRRPARAPTGRPSGWPAARR